MTFGRISTNLQNLRAINDISTVRKNFEELQSQMVTGKEVEKPKDNPLAFQQVLGINSRLERNEQYLNNLTYAIGQTNIASSTLSTIDDILLELKETADGLKSSLATSAERAATAIQVESLLEEVVQLANSKYLGKFLFGGTNTLSGTTATPSPYNATENSSGFITAVTRNADGIDNLIYREVKEGVEIAVNISGSAPFVPNGEGGSGDIFQTIINLRDALTNNDTNGIVNASNELDAAIEQVSEQEIILGLRENRLSNIESQLEGVNIEYKDQRSGLEDVDYSELLIKYNTAQTALQATLQTSSRLLQMSLLNFL